MRIKQNVELPDITRGNNEVHDAIVEFLDSDNANLKFECDDKTEATRIYNQAMWYRKKHELPCRIVRRTNDIYILRKEN